MTPEDKIADAAYTNARATVETGKEITAAIDRNTEAVERQTTWLQLPEEDPLLDVAKDIRDWLRVIFIFIVVATIVLLVAISSAKAAPLVSDGDEIASLGTEVRR